MRLNGLNIFASDWMNRRCTTTFVIEHFLLERLMTARALQNVSINMLLFKTRHLKPAATRHQLQGSIVYRMSAFFVQPFRNKKQLSNRVEQPRLSGSVSLIWVKHDLKFRLKNHRPAALSYRLKASGLFLSNKR